MKCHPIEILDKAGKLEGTGSKKAKVDLFKDWFNDPEDTRPVTERELYKIVEYANNPWYNYYTVTVPGLNQVVTDARRQSKEIKAGHKDIFGSNEKRLGWARQFETMFQLLDDMKSRKLPPNSAESRHAILTWAKKVGPGTLDIFRRILRKDLKIGMQASSFNQIYPNWVPVFRCSLAKPFDETKLEYPCFVDPKFDGERSLAFITYDGTEGSVTYFSRNGLEQHNFGTFSDDLLNLFKGVGNVVADCEAISKKGFQTLQKVPTYYNPEFDASNLQLMVFDWIPQDEFNTQKYDATQKERYVSLTKIFRNFKSTKVMLVDSRIANNFQEVEALFEYWVSEGLEGIIMKQTEGVYHFSTASKRNPAWMKMKPMRSEDLEIIGYEGGKSGKKWEGKVGSLLVARNDPERGKVIVGVKGGLTDYMHKNIVEVGDQLLYTKPDGEVVNLRGQIVEVTFDCVTEDGSLRFPRFKRRGDDLIRRDK